jgi:hypothetical protein
MAGDDASSDDDGVGVEPEGRLDAGADGEGQYELDVAAAATEVGSLETHGDVAAFLADFELDLDGVAAMEAAVVRGSSVGRGLGFGRIHGSALGLWTWLDGSAPEVIIGSGSGEVRAGSRGSGHGGEGFRGAKAGKVRYSIIFALNETA